MISPEHNTLGRGIEPMRISTIYKSTSPYQWKAGKYVRKRHLKALRRAKKNATALAVRRETKD
jgi:hypothetical protein